MIELPRPPFDLVNPRIKIFGIGNAGCNTLDRVMLDGIQGVDVVALNTDAQILTGSVAPHKVQIGQTITRGLGAGGDPELGKTAAEEGIGDILGGLAESNIVILVVGLGGGTGSGAAPVIAEVAREHGSMIVVVATLPFAFEGKRRMAQAEAALASLRQTADVLLCFENDKMGDAVAPNAPIQEAFAEADRTLSQVIRSLVAFTGRKGIVHTGFDELVTAFRGETHRSVFGCGEASGDNRAHEALDTALRNPLLGRTRLKDDVETVVVSISGGPDLTLNEVQILMEEFQKHVRDRTHVMFGAAIDPAMEGRLAVSILGGFEVDPPAEPEVPVPVARKATQRLPLPPRLTSQRPPVHVPQVVAPVEEPEAQLEEQQEEEEPIADEPVMASVSHAVPPGTPPVRPPLTRPVNLPPAASRPRPPREIRAEQMQLEPINRGRFEKSEPTIIDGQDLDVPTFLRRNLKK